MEITDLISESLERIEKKRKLIADNTGYNVQYCPCGHFREINYDEAELIISAKTHKYLDAPILSSELCPICNSQ